MYTMALDIDVLREEQRKTKEKVQLNTGTIEEMRPTIEDRGDSNYTIK